MEIAEGMPGKKEKAGEAARRTESLGREAQKAGRRR
jgi:hypothetical protein